MKSKKNHFYVVLSVLLLSILFQFSALAQDEIYRHISPRDGLPSGFIRNMMQDSKGFMWVGTNAGLGKHDGYSTTAYRHDPDDSTSISNGTVYDIIEYDETNFLLATFGGLTLFNPATEIFNLLKMPDAIPNPGFVTDLLLINEHSMWVASQYGLYHVDPATLTDKQPSIEFFRLPGFDRDQPANLNALATDSLKNLWVATDSSLFKFDLESKAFTGLGEVSDDAKTVIEGNIWSMYYSSGNDLLISSTTGLAILKEGDNEIREVKQLGEYGIEDLRAASFQTITENAGGDIWLSTGLIGAIKWNQETGDVVTYRTSETPNALLSDDVHYAFEDREGNVWFGYHFEGVSIMYDNSWNYETFIPFPDLPPSDPRNTITNVKMDDNGSLWATTTNGLIRNLGRENQEFFEFDYTKYDVLEGRQNLALIAFIHENKVYINSQGSSFLTGYIVFDPDNEADPFNILPIPGGRQVLPSPGILSGENFYTGFFNSNAIMIHDLTTGNMEVVEIPVEGVYTDLAFSVMNPHNMYENELYTKAYFINSEGNAEIEHFIVNLESKEVRKQEIDFDFPIRGIQPPLTSSYESGVVYLNTTGGLVRINNLNNSYNVLFKGDMALLREGSLIMTEDQEGYIWFNNLTGLTRVDPLTERFEYFEVPREQYTPIRAWPSTLTNGEVIFPGAGSYLRFNPSDLRSTQPVGETMITTLQAGPERFDLVYKKMEPEIEHGNNTLTFNFVGLDLRDPSSINYRYRILGSDNEQWTTVGTQRSVFVPNLSAGNYTFEVQSGSQFGTFDGETASLTFSVLQPWWNTVPAYIAYLILLVGLIALVTQYQKKRVIAQERERTREKELEHAKEIEKAYNNLEVAHKNLKSAQDQLVQQEKLASLGQLTAGIAHEIKNPLNFVNNFSELSIELLEEAKQELSTLSDQLSADDLKKVNEAGKILQDIEANLRKVHKHGTRADSIVKSMLQHSRGGSGVMEPTDLNALISEYTNLAFHGMRAGLKPINVSFDMQLDPAITKVSLIGEDFTRVILNLCNNAFDAMRETEALRTPTLRVSTQKTDQHVCIEIEDNGPGIPDELKEKILQPFFTTKKGTEGTGLGLSITHDIIKVHGGTIRIDSEKGRGSLFTILLPV